jgi:large subunit ribosomal protein L16
MLQPKRTKFRKVQKGRMKGNSGRGNQLSNGMFGIKSLDSVFITSRQIEAARVAATRYMKREGQLWIKIFPDKPITKKPLEVRMGKGKGAVEYYVAVVKPGRILFEIGGVPIDIAKEALRLAAQKLPARTKFVIARDYEALFIDIMKHSEIKELSTAELQEKLGETKKSYADLKLAHAVSPLENPIQLRTVRRTIARIATELTKRELQ